MKILQIVIIIISILINIILFFVITVRLQGNIEKKEIVYFRIYSRNEINNQILLAYDIDNILCFYSKITDCNNYISGKIIEYCLVYNVPINIMFSICYVESRFKHNSINYNPDSIDIGLFQLNTKSYSDYDYYVLFNIDLNIKLAVTHFYKDYKKYNSYELAIIAYNSGNYRIDKNKISKKSINYLNNVLNYEKYLDYNVSLYIQNGGLYGYQNN